MSEEFNPQLEQLLDYLKTNRGFDFAAYKRPGLGRRIEKRMQMLHVPGYAEYFEYLKAHPDEFTLLFNVILINVTEFFRDAPAWEYLAAEIIPSILARKPAHEHIRVWSAGCASGEEAYSAAMLFGEALGKAALFERVKVYATDVDDEALASARLGRYSQKAVEGVPQPLLEKYFVRDNEVWDFDRDVRREVIFGRHDLLEDPPISRIDLLLCRNTLMYFTNESQRRVLARLHFAVRDGGYLFLGRAEMLLTHGNLFTPVDLKRRFFTKVPQTPSPERMAPAQAPAGNGKDNGGADKTTGMAGGAFEISPDVQIVLDAKGTLVLANERARTLLRLDPRVRAAHYRELDLPVDVLRLIEQTFGDASATRLTDMRLAEVPWTSAAGDPAFYKVALRPIRELSGAVDGISIVLQDITDQRRLQEHLQRSRHELETVSEELQSSNEELETTNEELQSTVEELETTNEELQSTNEELETMNEELQSTNEELHTMNGELRERSDDLNSVNGFLASVLSGIREGLVVVDRTGQITAWNPAAEELWGLRAAEVLHRPFFRLDIGLPVDQLGAAVRGGLNGESGSVTVQAVNRRGKSVSCTVVVTPLKSSTDAIEGAVLLMQAKDG